MQMGDSSRGGGASISTELCALGHRQAQAGGQWAFDVGFERF